MKKQVGLKLTFTPERLVTEVWITIGAGGGSKPYIWITKEYLKHIHEHIYIWIFTLGRTVTDLMHMLITPNLSLT